MCVFISLVEHDIIEDSEFLFVKLLLNSISYENIIHIND